MVGGDQRRAGQPRDDESDDHAARRLDPEKKSRRASERNEAKRTGWREQTRGIDPARFVWVDETGSDLSLTRTHSRAPRGQRAYGDVPGRRGPNRTLITAMTVEGFGPRLLLDEAIDRTTFDGYIIHRLAPTLQPDQIVVVDNLKVHYSERAREAIEARGAQLWYLPAYSPDLTPIEEAFSKVKAALRTSGPRTVEAHSTYRKRPTTESLEKWITAVPETFRFAAKAHAAISHQRDLDGIEDRTVAFFTALESLGARRGPVMYSLPHKHVDLDRLGKREEPVDQREPPLPEVGGGLDLPLPDGLPVSRTLQGAAADDDRQGQGTVGRQDQLGDSPRGVRGSFHQSIAT